MESATWRQARPLTQPALITTPQFTSIAPKSKKWEPRYQVILAMFLATLTAYVERTGFSIAYTQMAAAAGVTEAAKGTVMSAFFWGYALSQIPGGLAAQRYGGDGVLSGCFLLWSVASLLTPGTADSLGAMIFARIFIGIAQGFLIPAVHTVLSSWIPPQERARAVSLTTSGMYLGSATAMQVLPAIAALLGPSFLLRLVGVMGLGWMMLWKATLQAVKRVEGTGTLSPKSPYRKNRPLSPPWKIMLTSPAIWAIVVNNYTFHYAFYVIMNWLPTYYDKLIRVPLANMGVVKMLPYIVMFAASNAGGWAGDYVITKMKRSVAEGRKVVNTVGFLSAVCMLLIMPGARSVGKAIIYTTATLGSLGFARGGFSVNHMDIAPKFAGAVMGVSNTAGTVGGVLGVAITGRLLDAAGGADKALGWYQAFGLAGIQCGIGIVVFLRFARGDRVFGGETQLYN